MKSNINEGSDRNKNDNNQMAGTKQQKQPLQSGNQNGQQGQKQHSDTGQWQLGTPSSQLSGTGIWHQYLENDNKSTWYQVPGIGL